MDDLISKEPNVVHSNNGKDLEVVFLTGLDVKVLWGAENAFYPVFYTSLSKAWDV